MKSTQPCSIAEVFVHEKSVAKVFWHLLLCPPMAITSSERFNFITTDDGSPSMSFNAEPGSHSEAMHNLKGAFGETIYVYGRALSRMNDLGLNQHVMSLGLGIGYNEILSAATFVKAKKLDHAQIDSFEIDADLRELFALWINGAQVPAEFQKCYDTILTLTAKSTNVSESAIKDALSQLLKSDRLRLRDALTPTISFDRKYSCYLFDAFSSKTSPELWSEEFLTDFISKTAEPRAVFSTYACTGNLKRTLIALGFTLEIREGFSSKRDCTFAVRG
jgi:hypothetical protein